MSKYNDVDNTELVELIERGLRKVKNDLLLYCEAFVDDYDDFVYIETDLVQQIKELENEKED